MSNRNGYSRPAIRTQVAGVWYDSQLEGRFAMLLIKHGIKFTPHVTFHCFDRDGKPFDYTVDFVFDIPQKFAGIDFTLDFVETKGVLSKHAIKRNRAMSYCHSLKGYCVGYELIDFWEREGIRW